MNTKIIILAGGEGKRLWPLTEKVPKPFLPLLVGRSLFETTVQRFVDNGYGDAIVCTTPVSQLSFVKEQLARFPIPQNILLEPSLRDTGPATLWAVKMLLEKGEIGEEGRCLLVPCDQVLDDESAFFAQLESALKVEARLRVFGMECDKFDPSYGYFSVEGERVMQFVEKPQSWGSGKALRNSGLFLFTPKLLRKEDPIVNDFLEGRVEYEGLPKLSLDRMLLEKSSQLFYHPLGTRFVDLGTLQRLLQWTSRSPLPV